MNDKFVLTVAVVFCLKKVIALCVIMDATKYLWTWNALKKV